MKHSTACLFFFTMHYAFSQTAQLTGRVTDVQQAVLVGAEVVATNVATQVIRRTVTNEQGLYSIPGLLPGEYQLSAGHAGFRSERRSSLRLIVDHQSFRMKRDGTVEFKPLARGS